MGLLMGEYNLRQGVTYRLTVLVHICLLFGAYMKGSWEDEQGHIKCSDWAKVLIPVSARTSLGRRGRSTPFASLQLLVPILLGEARAALKWADGKMIKHEVDMQVGTSLSEGGRGRKQR